MAIGIAKNTDAGRNLTDKIRQHLQVLRDLLFFFFFSFLKGFLSYLHSTCLSFVRYKNAFEFSQHGFIKLTCD